MKFRSTVIIVVLGLIVSLGTWRWLERSTRPPETPPPGVSVTKTLPTPSQSAPVVLPEPSAPAPASSTAASVETPVPLAPSPAAGRPTVSDILSEPGDDLVKVAKKLAALVADPSLPLADRTEALAHTLNLSAGNEAEVLTPLVKDSKLPDSLTGTILDEALNRPLSYQADLYLTALTTHKSPEMQQKIREHLKFLTNGEDLGSNPTAWEAPLKEAKKSWGE
jgi:hypothetical protein